MEQLGRLSALLASFSALPWLVLITGPQGTSAFPYLAAPKLSLAPSHRIFVQGEQVKLTCTVPKGKQAQTFFFDEWNTYHDEWILAKEQNESTWEVPVTHFDSKQTFACYYILDSRKSRWSNYVAFSVTAPPPSPTLSLQPQNSVYLQGELVTLTCSIHEGKKTAEYTYTFYQEIGDQVFALLRGHYRRMFRVDENTAGRYSCVYWIWKSGREIQSLRSNTVSVVRIELPQPPTLFLQPQHPVYIQGENITLNCSAPAKLPLAQFAFYKGQGGQMFKGQPKGHHYTFGLDGNTAGWFYCLYWISVSGRTIWSPRSISVSVARTESPQPPTVSLQPQHPVYIQGEDITLICSAPGEENATGYSFYQEIRGQVLEVLSGNHHATLRVEEESAGKYSCVYWIRVSGRKIQSQWSNSVYVNRADPLRPPELKADPPSGAVNQGEPLLISCLANRRNTEKRFHFYKDGVEMDSSNEGSISELGGPSPNATLRIPQANSSHSGGFACSFEENMSSRWISSPWSHTVNITVQAQDSSVRALGYSCLTLLFTVMVSLACYFRWRRKRASEVEKPFPAPRNKEETDCLERLEPQPAQTEARRKRPIAVEEEGASYSEIQFPPSQGPKSVEEEEVSYSEIQFCLNSLQSMEEDSALYSNVQFQPLHGLKPEEKDQVLYSAIQF